MFRKVTKYFGTGLVAVLPFALVIWMLALIFRFLDGLLGPFVDGLLGYRIPGVGALAIIVGVTLVGMLTRMYFSYRALILVESLFQRIPFVKSLYTMFKELVQNVIGKKHGFQRVVLLNWPDDRAQVIAFVTREEAPPELEYSGEKMVVYIPNSFQWAGITAIVHKSQVQDCPLTVEEALKLVLSAGLGQSSVPYPYLEDGTH